ncbi:DUF3291 domain-containing protein [Nocardiopsis mangrovi]|uniref:DUF3291 domain-containing protein n=1 Tax=Nocardiopsis mangrovi TaxID=1179818 RepID=A0ABV9E501_9ACTN
MSPSYHLAQVNIGTFIHPLDDPRTAGFADMLAPVNALAEASPGFVWRLVGDGGTDATSLRPYGDGAPDTLINLSVWESMESLWEFTYRTEHIDLLRRRREWFVHMKEVHAALWWVPAGHLPTVGEAVERLALLRGGGPTAEAFTFRDAFPPPEGVAVSGSESA